MNADLVSQIKSALVGELEELLAAVKELTTKLSEPQFWAKPIQPGNSVGHLILHLTGNLKHFVGAKLEGTGYVRDREREFMESELPAKSSVLSGLDEAVHLFRRVVIGLTAEQLAAPYPEVRFGPVVAALIHLVAHFALHRGQMSYLARLVTTDN